MKLEKPSKEFIKKTLKLFADKEGDELNENLLKLFRTFNDDKNKFHVIIKVAALNKIYSTAITNINPVVEKIVKASNENITFKNIDEYIEFVDKIAKIKWVNSKETSFERNNLSFASKYVHFLSGFKAPIYDSYIWIVINGYLGQNHNQKISFKNPKSYREFYNTFEKFKKDLGLEKYTNYQIDKFLWQYGKSMITDIELELNTTLDKAKAELKKRIIAN